MLTKKTQIGLGFGTLGFAVLNLVFLFVTFVWPNFFPDGRFGGRIGTDLLWAMLIFNLVMVAIAIYFLFRFFLRPKTEDDIYSLFGFSFRSETEEERKNKAIDELLQTLGRRDPHSISDVIERLRRLRQEAEERVARENDYFRRYVAAKTATK